jgi:hypothetical protein
MITLGGDAELELVDSLDPFSEVGANLQGCCGQQACRRSCHTQCMVCICELPTTLVLVPCIAPGS